MNLISVAGWAAGLFGFGLLVAGVMLMSVPVGLIVAGVLLLFWAYLADRAAAAAAGIARASQAKE